MSEHVEHEHVGNWRVPFFTNGPVEVARPAERDGQNQWKLAAVILGGTIASYGVAIGAIYFALTAAL
jgi:hypothetical protein